jgi:maltose O-acetyltransferase
MNELEKMNAGMIYDPSNELLLNARKKAHKLCTQYNATYEDDPLREKILDDLMGEGASKKVFFQGPIYCDYGFNIKAGNNIYANFNLTVLDVCPVTIEDNVFMGPNVSIVTPVHPFLAKERALYKREDGVVTDKEYGKPITIKHDCWIASNVTICGGVTIGECCVIGAGSVVTRDIPPHSLAAGNPAKVIRQITEKDSIYLKKKFF